MTPSRRIFLNIIATYGRSLYALVIGLFTARWALMALGEVDYGLMGVVGGLTAFVEFFNTLLANSIGRFYGYYIGAAKVNSDENKGVEDCRKWFNTALLIHTVLPVILIVIGYPIGAWAVRNFLAIPSDRIFDCVWVWRFACASCFVGMISVPFSAMYYAKQEIAELTIYSVVSTTLKALFLYYMVSHPGIWLARYALLGCFVFVIPQLIICTRAMICYNECRFNASYLWDKSRMRKIGIYALSRLWAAVSTLCNDQGQSVLVNKYLGPVANASMAIGLSVASHAATLSTAISGAFNPAVVNFAGEGNLERMRQMAFMACKLSSVMLLIFALPIALEIDEVMQLWLKTPPPFAGELCLYVMIVIVMEKLTDGHWMCILAMGRVAKYSFVVGCSGVIALILAWGCMGIGYGILSLGVVRVIMKSFEVVVRMYFGRTIAGLSYRYWFRFVLFPLTIAVILAGAVGMSTRLFMAPSFARCLLTMLIVDVSFIALIWFVVLAGSEKEFISIRWTFVRKRIFSS